jgi:GNAT superfamily N-acetyltransferase
VSDDAALLHSLAERTFPLACPPESPPEAIADFIERQLSAEAFAGYLSAPERALYIIEVDGEPSGYTMVIYGEPSEADVVASVTAHPTAELSKFYMLAAAHGSGAAAVLMEATVEAARTRGVAGIWLGVNDQNARANRFYEKSGFVTVGRKRFRLGERWEDDFVRERVL